MANSMTSHQLAESLGTSKQTLKIILRKNRDSKIVPDTSVKSPKSRAILYPVTMAEALKNAYNSNKFGKRRNRGPLAAKAIAGKAIAAKAVAAKMPKKVAAPKRKMIAKSPTIMTPEKPAQDPIAMLMSELADYKRLKEALTEFMKATKGISLI